MAYRVDINGEVRELDVPGEMPLLWALRNELGMVGTKFGCGMRCAVPAPVHVDGAACALVLDPGQRSRGQEGDHDRGARGEPDRLARCSRPGSTRT
jgi:isoquinoline 1-oxidoreductase alpha subunit